MAKKNRVQFLQTIAPGWGNTKLTKGNSSLVGVASRQHCGKAGHFHLATRAFARLLVMAMGADFLQSTFAVQPFLEPAQRLIDRLAFFQLNFCQLRSLPSGGSDPTSPAWRVRVGSKSADPRGRGGWEQAQSLKDSKLKGRANGNREECGVRGLVPAFRRRLVAVEIPGSCPLQGEFTARASAETRASSSVPARSTATSPRTPKPRRA